MKNSILFPVIRLKSTDVSEEHVASNFSAEEYAKQVNSVKQAASSCLLKM
jgi:hypothetical protein